MSNTIGAELSQHSSEGDSKIVLELNEDITVEIEQAERGIIKAGTLLIAEEIESGFKLQWGNTYIVISGDKVQEVNEDRIIELSMNYDEKMDIGYINPTEDFEILLDEEGLNLHVLLRYNQEYPIIGETEESYETIIGNRSVSISKSEGRFVFFENTIDSGPEVTEQEKALVSEEKQKENSDVMSGVTSQQIKMLDKNSNYNATKYGSYFKVINKEAVVYDNRSGKLVKIGVLEEGQTYPISSDYGNWHRIQFGTHYGYVHKENTTAGNKSSIKNQNTSYKNSIEKIKTDKNTKVYDNTSGNLVPFGELEKGMEYVIVSDYGNWYRVIFANRIGYILKSDVTRMFTNQTKYFEVIGSNVEVYDNRTGKLIKIGTLEKGQIYQRVSDYGNWHRIQYGDHYGYVRKSGTIASNGASVKNFNIGYHNSNEKFIASDNAYVYDNTGKELVPFTKIEKGKVFPIVADYGNWYRVLIANRIGYIDKNTVNGYFSNGTKHFEVIKDGLEVYDNRQAGSLKKIGELKKGQVYERVSDYGNWHRIQFGNHYGYVLKNGTLANFKNKIPNYNTNYKNTNLTFTTTRNAAVYDNTTGKLVPFAQIEKGKVHPVVSDYGNWYRILIANKVGYINKNDVKIDFNNNIKYFKVTKSDLPIYDNRSGSLAKVGSLTKGQTYERVSDYGNWHRIKFGDYYGYVRKADTEPSLSNLYKNKITANYSNGTLTPKKNIVVYDNTKGKLVPFATIDKNKKYPVVRDYGNWYEVNISGRSGFVRKNEVNATVMVAKNIVNPNREYTYENLVTDINQLSRAYPGLISWKTIGKSVDGRNLYAIKLGTGKKEIFLNGSHHAREWLTTNLLMEMIDEYSQSYVNNQSYGGYNVRSILNDTSIWFVPMVNPDGVTLVQKGAFSAKNPGRVIQLNGGSTDFRAWKANIRGVDLNRQYPAGWSTISNNRAFPAPQNHKGAYPLSEPESKAIYDFTLAHDFKTAVAYHSSGEILYWDYKTTGSLKTLSRRIANQISSKTGYGLVISGPNPSGGGYTDWFLESVKRPGFTPEISPYVGPRPVPLSNFDSIWRKNNTIGLMLAQEASKR
jgi:g-D-glutamyl-meso-diaminopimelate peptidase